jgi:hypothetical protein
MRVIRWLAALLCLAGMALGAYGVFIEPGRLVVHSVTVKTAAWPATHPPMRIAFLTDLHVGAPHIDLARIREIVRRTNALKPDLVLLGGDYVIDGVLGGTVTRPRPIAQALTGFDAKHGVVAVLGNHDWWNDGNAIRKALEAVGIRVLENQSLAIRHGGQQVWIAGIADNTTRRPDPVGVLSRIAGSDPIVVLAHDPAVFPTVPKRAALILAGHMHGGQVYLPLLGAIITPGKAPNRHAFGLIHEDGRKMYVGAGIGTSIIPIRINMPPEIAIVTVRGNSSKQDASSIACRDRPCP